jgi:hypothetical protein
MTETLSCELEALLGRDALCEGEPCPFWRVGDGCAFETAMPELAGRADVAALLLSVRDRLAADSAAFRTERLSEFAHALNKGDELELH